MGEILEGIRHLPLHPAAQVQLFLALEGGPGMLHIRQHTAQPASNGMGRLAAEGLKGIDRGKVGLGSQFTGQQQQQLAQLEGEAAAEEGWFVAGHAIERQQHLLLQHPFPAVFTTELADHRGNRPTALGFGDQ